MVYVVVVGRAAADWWWRRWWWCGIAHRARKIERAIPPPARGEVDQADFGGCRVRMGTFPCFDGGHGSFGSSTSSSRLISGGGGGGGEAVCIPSHALRPSGLVDVAAYVESGSDPGERLLQFLTPARVVAV